MKESIATYWDGYAPAYDLEHDHGLTDPDAHDAWRSLLQEWLPEHPCEVADLACGTGSLTALAAELGHTVTGVDLSEEMVALARDKNDVFGDRVHIRQGDVSWPELPDHSMDVVLARHILWTLPDPHAALERWVDLVRPGGRLVLVEGRWWTAGQAETAHQPEPAGGREPAMPWSGGVRAADLVDALRPLVDDVTVVPLRAPVFWGKELSDERYLLVAS